MPPVTFLHGCSLEPFLSLEFERLGLLADREGQLPEGVRGVEGHAEYPWGVVVHAQFAQGSSDGLPLSAVCFDD